MNAAIVIPARWGSTRFPGKPLVRIAGVSLIERVYRRAVTSRRADAVYVATDDERILGHVADFGGKVVRPEGDFATGTDRIAAAVPLLEAMEGRTFAQIVNVQGDEPLIDVANVDALIEALQHDVALAMATLACPLADDEEFLSRDVVKVVSDARGDALYFSRAAIPHGARALARRHIGVYAYQRAALETFVALPPSSLESAESLEQLRALQNGLKIRVVQTSQPHLGVDRPEDVERVETELAKHA
jgi:3-deoxy-manno-octulosonate cytidylyltransferase (CMP-KDO synthetase)